MQQARCVSQKKFSQKKLSYCQQALDDAKAHHAATQMGLIESKRALAAAKHKLSIAQNFSQAESEAIQAVYSAGIKHRAEAR